MASAALGALSPHSQVYKDECMFCHATPANNEHGLAICLHCFQGYCVEHQGLHAQRTNHALYLHLKKTLVVKAVDDDAQPAAELTKVAIGVDGGAAVHKDEWLTATSVRSYFGDASTDYLASGDAELTALVSGVLDCHSVNEQAEVQSWEQVIAECRHAVELQQQPDAPKLPPKSLSHCGECELASNLWLCMTCGHLGCGRRNFDGSGGNGHAVAHSQHSGHPLVCKMGTMTAEGTADLFCYSCDDPTKDSQLAAHFAHFGIDLTGCTKTEATTGEMELKLNKDFAFSSGEEVQLGEPAYGPGFTGMVNVGNSCYLASVVQNLFNVPAFRRAYADGEQHYPVCAADTPARCYRCQFGKLHAGLYGGKYSRPSARPDSVDQEGIAPHSFKYYLAGDNPDWKGKEQQDAYEYFQHVVDFVQRNDPAGPAAALRFRIEQRIECSSCHRVGYRSELNSELAVVVPSVAHPQPDADGPAMAEHERNTYVPFDQLLSAAFFPETASFSCPTCGVVTSVQKSTALRSVPDCLAVVVRRQEVKNWVPRKVHTSVLIDDAEHLSLAHYVSQRDTAVGEQLFPDNDQAPAPAVEFPRAVLDALLAMGFSENRCKHGMLSSPAALNDAEAAMAWIFGTIDDPKYDEPPALPGQPAGFEFPRSVLDALLAMGFSENRCKHGMLSSPAALNDAEAAMAWIFTTIDDPKYDEPPALPGQPAEFEFPRGVLDALLAMGFSENRCKHGMLSSPAALNDAEAAMAWIFTTIDDASFDEPVPAERLAAAAAAAAGSATPAAAEEDPAAALARVTNSRFALIGFVEHRGATLHSGHYIAYLRKDGAWYQFNDARVRACPNPPLNQAYMLFYQRLE